MYLRWFCVAYSLGRAEDGMSQARRTHDHQEIRTWIEARGGRPAVVSATESNGRSGGVLRVDFGDPDPGLDIIEWDEFFEIFDSSDLDFLHQDETADGKPSRFNKFVARSDGDA